MHEIAAMKRANLQFSLDMAGYTPTKKAREATILLLSILVPRFRLLRTNRPVKAASRNVPQRSHRGLLFGFPRFSLPSLYHIPTKVILHKSRDYNCRSQPQKKAILSDYTQKAKAHECYKKDRTNHIFFSGPLVRFEEVQNKQHRYCENNHQKQPRKLEVASVKNHPVPNFPLYNRSPIHQNGSHFFP